MRLDPLIGRLWRGGAAVLWLGLAGCAGSSSDSNPFAKAPDWASFTGASKTTVSKVVTAEDLIAADGSCAGGPQVAAAAEESQTVGNSPAEASPTPASASPGGFNDPLLQPVLGIGLGMSECEVARRAGMPQSVQIGADDRNERLVVLTYTRGERAGIYRFREGRLFTIERVAVAEPEPAKKPAKVAKPKPSQPAAAKPVAASKPAPAPAPKNSPWPDAPPQTRNAGVQAPAQGAQSPVWPSPPPLRSAN